MFQVVFQFPANFFANFDEIVAFEDKLIHILPSTCEHTGHDTNEMTVNFFVLTPFPQALHLTFRKYLGTNKIEKKLRIAYKTHNTDEAYINIWPKRDVRPFVL
jgi:hypothetical protein